MTKIKTTFTVHGLFEKPAGAFLDNSDGNAKRRRYVLSVNLLSTVFTNLISGFYLTGLLLAVGADDFYVSLVTMATKLCGFVHFFAPLLWERLTRRKPLILSFRGLYHFLNIAVPGMLLFLPLNRNGILTFYLAAIIGSNLLSALTAPALSIWTIQAVPDEKKNNFFTISNLCSSVLGLVSGYCAGRVVDCFEAGEICFLHPSPTVTAILILRIPALLFAGAELIFLGKLKEDAYGTQEKTHGLKMLLLPFGNPVFLKTISISVLWTFITEFIGEYFNVYLLDIVDVSYSYLSLCGMVNVPLLLLLTPFWSSCIERIGWYRALALAFTGYSIAYFFNICIFENTQFFYLIVMICVYLFLPCINIVTAYLPYLYMPETTRTAFIGFYSISIMLSGFLGNLAGTVFMTLTKDLTFPVFSVRLVNYQYANLVQAFGVLLLAPYTRYVVRATEK